MSKQAREWSNDVKDLGDKIMGLTRCEPRARDYRGRPRNRSAAAPVLRPVRRRQPARCSGGAGKDEFTVILTGSGDKKIQVIKVVRELTGLGPGGRTRRQRPKPVKRGRHRIRPKT
jgi:hypothetical protein